MRNIAVVGWFPAACVVAAMMLMAFPAMAQPELPAGSSSGLPVPRFVSLKPDKVNVRAGPTRNHDVAWQFTRSGLPVEITAESDNWRRIRDWEGSEGWVYHSLLSGRRTAMVTSKHSGARSTAPASTVGLRRSGSGASIRTSWCRKLLLKRLYPPLIPAQAGIQESSF
jgi:SH3-like domain-containing protein